jgi:hypothetical protein
MGHWTHKDSSTNANIQVCVKVTPPPPPQYGAEIQLPRKHTLGRKNLQSVFLVALLIVNAYLEG